MRKYSVDVNLEDREQLLKIIKSCIGTKFISKWNDLMCGIALDAVKTVFINELDRKEIDIKRYIRVERVSPPKTTFTLKIIFFFFLGEDSWRRYC